jgi:hypothetical protein
MSTEDKTPVFPYNEIWEELSTELVTIEDLLPRVMIFKTRFRLLAASGSPTPEVETSTILALMDGLELPSSQREILAQQLYLVAGYYLGPDHLKQWQTDIHSSARALRNVRKSAGDLSRALRQISSDVSRALGVLHEVDSDALEPKSSLDTPILTRQLADLERVADTAIRDISKRKRGRRTNFVRFNALRLAVELTEATCPGRVTISPGNKQNHEPHFTGPLGGFVRKFFKLIAPNLSERTLVQNLGQIRRSAA